MTRQSFRDALLVAVTAGAFSLAVLAFRWSRPPAPPETKLEVRAIDDWKRFATPASTIGRPDAPVEIVEFSDYQCPFCRRLAATLDEVQRRHPDVRVQYRHFPLQSIHDFAYDAALAAECANGQGRFAEYTRQLFGNQADLGRVSWAEFARRAGVPDTAAFSNCVRRSAPADRVAKDVAAARQLGLTGTPALLIGNRLIPGNLSAASIDSLLARHADELRVASRR